MNRVIIVHIMIVLVHNLVYAYLLREESTVRLIKKVLLK
jgi:hypothetical protein